jgi:hypothetical protein
MEHVTATPEAPLEVVIQPLKPSDLFFFGLIRHGTLTRAAKLKRTFLNDCSYVSRELLPLLPLGNIRRLSSSSTACSPHRSAPLMIAPAARLQPYIEQGGRTGQSWQFSYCYVTGYIQ